MENEQLLQYFCENYLPKQEVLFRLPFNIPLESFWSELLSQRKRKAVMLPLHNAKGYPYWYVLTDKMIKASERLCAKAREQNTPFDPYRIQMTEAMTEEMFYTSFVEGAQISFEEAMDFLESGNEPENIFEQMIWNNRQAWSAMVGGLYHRIDESFLTSLAQLLTEGMDGAAEGYRETDTHPIAAMEGEHYEVPSAYDLHRHMEEFYSFMGAPNIHPLIKAAAGQAFLLCTRPFPEGNERIGRMVSSAVLLRSGYDFFRDISISGTIATENYWYYKNMREVLRPENGEDLTYFMEFYLELLVKALDRKKERDRRRELAKEQTELARQQDLLEKERELGTIPLESLFPEAVTPVNTVKLENTDELMKIEKPISNSALVQEKSRENLEPADVLQRLIPRIRGNDIQDDQEKPPPVFDRNLLNDIIERIRISKLNKREDIIEFLKQKYDEGVIYTTCKDVEKEFGCSRSVAQKTCNNLVNYGAAVNISESGFTAKYLFCYVKEYDKRELETPSESLIPDVESIKKALSLSENKNEPLHVSGPVIEKIWELSVSSQSSLRRIAVFLQTCIIYGKKYFTAREWSNVFGRSMCVSGVDLRRARCFGLIEICGSAGGYKICAQINTKEQKRMLPAEQLELLKKFHKRIGDEEFIVSEFATFIQNSYSNTVYYLKTFTDTGILQSRLESGIMYYRFSKGNDKDREIDQVHISKSRTMKKKSRKGATTGLFAELYEEELAAVT